jgi:hypothetical protein
MNGKIAVIASNTITKLVNKLRSGAIVPAIWSASTRIASPGANTKPVQ